MGFGAETPGSRAGRAARVGFCGRWAMRRGEQRSRGRASAAGVGAGARDAGRLEGLTSGGLRTDVRAEGEAEGAGLRGARRGADPPRAPGPSQQPRRPRCRGRQGPGPPRAVWRAAAARGLGAAAAAVSARDPWRRAAATRVNRTTGGAGAPRPPASPCQTDSPGRPRVAFGV